MSDDQELKAEAQQRETWVKWLKTASDFQVTQEYRKSNKGSVHYDVLLGEVIRRGLDDEHPQD